MLRAGQIAKGQIRDQPPRHCLGSFEQGYREEGGALYAPEPMLGVWLYTYALGIIAPGHMLHRRFSSGCAWRSPEPSRTVTIWSAATLLRRSMAPEGQRTSMESAFAEEPRPKVRTSSLAER